MAAPARVEVDYSDSGYGDVHVNLLDDNGDIIVVVDRYPRGDDECCARAEGVADRLARALALPFYRCTASTGSVVAKPYCPVTTR